MSSQMNFQVPSLSMLSNPLPQVIKPVASQVINPADNPVVEEKVELIEVEKQPIDDKIVIILHTKDITQEDRDLLKKFGSVRDLNYSMFNIPLENLDCDYLLVDCRNKLNKLHITRVDVDKFKFVAYVFPFEKHDNIFEDFIPNLPTLTKFPKDYKVAYKSEFDDVLTSVKKIKNSSCALSLLSFLVNGLSSVLKK